MLSAEQHPLVLQVRWYEEFKTFAFYAPPDSRLMIRHAPLPLLGSPWPMPLHYHPHPTMYRVTVGLQFRATSYTCDVLTFAFARATKAIFGETPPERDVDFVWSRLKGTLSGDLLSRV